MKFRNEKLKLTLAMAFVGSIGVFVKWLNMPSAMISFFRALIGACVIILWMKINPVQVNRTLIKKRLPLLIVSGLMMALNWIFLFEAFKWTSISVATICYYLAPAIIIGLSPIFFKEKLTWLQFFVVSLSLIGIYFISGAFDEAINVNLIGVIYGLLAACLYASVMIVNKSLANIEPLSKTAIQLIVAAFSMGVYSIIVLDFKISDVTIWQWIFLLIVGIFHTGIAYVVMFQAFDRLPSQTASLLTYIDPVAALMFSYIIFQQQLSLWQWIGAALVIGSSFIYQKLSDKKI